MQILNLNLKLSNCERGWAYADVERSGTFWRDGRQLVGLAAGGKHAASHVHTINPAGRHGGANCLMALYELGERETDSARQCEWVSHCESIRPRGAIIDKLKLE